MNEDSTCPTRGTSNEEWEALVEENVGWLRGWAVGQVRDPELADDICQDAFLKAFRSRRKLRDVSRFPSWLFRIASNTLRDHLRSAVRQRRHFKITHEFDDVPDTDEESAALTLERKEESEKLLARVRELPPRYREPLLLRHAQDLPYAEISKILGISENAVQVRIFRARKMLRERGSQS